jgi:FixJ family two-component response regulator
MQRLVHATIPARSDQGGHEPIFVVDDNVWVGELITELLESQGLDAVAYVSINDFLADEQHRQPGCLIIDEDIPETEGLEVVQALRDKGVLVPTILITGKLDTSNTSSIRELGILAVLQRPFSVARLIEAVRAGLNRSV